MFSKGVLAIFGLFLIFLVPDIHLSISDLMLYLSMNMSTDMLLLLKQDFSCTKINKFGCFTNYKIHRSSQGNMGHSK